MATSDPKVSAVQASVQAEQLLRALREPLDRKPYNAVYRIVGNDLREMHTAGVALLEAVRDLEAKVDALPLRLSESRAEWDVGLVRKIEFEASKAFLAGHDDVAQALRRMAQWAKEEAKKARGIDIDQEREALYYHLAVTKAVHLPVLEKIARQLKPVWGDFLVQTVDCLRNLGAAAVTYDVGAALQEALHAEGYTATLKRV